jgi:lysophospholipase L1-like esterase
VTTKCTPASGSSFEIGSTTVSCAASDAASRSAACSIQVTVDPPPPRLSVTTFTAFGDSVTEGENALPGGPLFVDVPNSYPTQLQTLMQASFPGQAIAVLARGSGGEKLVNAGLERLSAVLAADKPGALLLMDGYNDLEVCGFFSGVTPDCKAAIDLLGFGVRDGIRIGKGPPNNIRYIFVGTLTPPGVVAPGAPDRRRSPDAIVQTNARIRAFVATEGATLVDIHPLFLGHEQDYVSVDGLHMTPAGNQTIASAFLAAIKATIPEAPTPAPGVR